MATKNTRAPRRANTAQQQTQTQAQPAFNAPPPAPVWNGTAWVTQGTPPPPPPPPPAPVWNGTAWVTTETAAPQGYGQANGNGYDNTDRGVLFKNSRKNPGTRQPDYTGNVNVGGETFWISGWMRKDKKGNAYMSLAVTAQDQDGHPHQDMNPPVDDLPF